MPHIGMRALMIGLMIVGLSSLAQATPFIIELTNGNAVRTPYVWEEGDEVKFFIYDGTAGVPKALVRRITTAPPVSDDRGAPDAAMPRDATPPTADHVPQPEGQRHVTTGDASPDRATKATLTSQLEEATTRYREASDAGHVEAKQTALADMRASRKQILELSGAVKAKHAGELPAWWNE